MENFIDREPTKFKCFHSSCCAAAYGDRARRITEIAEQQKLGRRLVRGHPQLEARVVACFQSELHADLLCVICCIQVGCNRLNSFECLFHPSTVVLQ